MVLIRWPQKKKDFKQCKKTAQELSFWNFLRLLLVYFWNTIFFKQKCYWTSSLIAPQMTQYSHWLDPECSGWSVPVDQYPRISNSAATLGGLASIDFIVWANSYSLLGRTRSRCRCWAAIRLCHRPEASGRAVHGEVDWLDIGGQHGRRFVLLRHTHRPQRRPYPICTSRSGKWVSSFEAPCVCTRWAAEDWVEQMSRLHGTAC